MLLKEDFLLFTEVDSQSVDDSFREYSPSLNVSSDVLDNNSKTPFLNIK